MKKEILAWLTYSRDFNSGIQLWYKYGRNKVYMRAFNLQGNTKSNIDILHEEFRKMIGASFEEFTKILKKPVKASPVKKEPAAKKPEVKKKTITAKVGVAVKPVTQQKLREEFPFSTDPKCPYELKVLVADKLSAYYRYLDGRKNLSIAKSNPEQLKAAQDTVEGNMENKAIYQELDHYKKHGKILGYHGLFARMNKLKEFNSKTTEELCNLRENIGHSIWRNESIIEKAKKPHLNKKRQDKIEEYKWEVVEIQKIIDVRV